MQQTMYMGDGKVNVCNIVRNSHLYGVSFFYTRICLLILILISV